MYGACAVLVRCVLTVSYGANRLLCCHDLKMLYCLVGKVNWNNQYRSNLLCLCNKQEGVVDNNGNKCVLMMDENFISRW